MAPENIYRNSNNGNGQEPLLFDPRKYITDRNSPRELKDLNRDKLKERLYLDWDIFYRSGNSAVPQQVRAHIIKEVQEIIQVMYESGMLVEPPQLEGCKHNCHPCVGDWPGTTASTEVLTERIFMGFDPHILGCGKLMDDGVYFFNKYVKPLQEGL